MKKRILSLVLGLALVVVAAINPMISYATSESTGTPTEMKIDDYRTAKATGTDADGNAYEYYTNVPDAPEGYDNYVFAGWYTTSACTTPIAESVTEGTYWAKWVPKNVLSVKWQITSGTKAGSTSTGLRLVTTVDSINYQSVGFVLNKGGVNSKPAMSNTVYKTILGGGNTYYPDQSGFDDLSEFFMVYEIIGIPNSDFAEEIQVMPQWETLDGTVVTGVQNQVKINEGFADFMDGVGFEKIVDASAFDGWKVSGAEWADATMERIDYTSAGISAPTNGGNYGLKLSHTFFRNPRFVINFGEELPAGSKLTFVACPDVEVTDYNDTLFGVVVDRDNPGQELTRSNLFTFSGGWQEITITLAEATDHLVMYWDYSWAHTAEDWPGAIYLDNFVIIPPTQ